jgi:hypothetical protein
MICASAAGRPASEREHGRKTESTARTVQMITSPNNASKLASLCESNAGAVSPQHRRHRKFRNLSSLRNFPLDNLDCGSFSLAF